MTDRHTEMHLAQVRNTRRIAGEVLWSIAGALYLAAATLGLLLILHWWFTTDIQRDSYDFPGRYLFVILPLLSGAAFLHVRSGRVTKGL